MGRSVSDRTDAPLAILLGALVFVGLTWRLSFVVTDNWTLANTLVAVADGHLHFTEVIYGPDSGGAPGSHLVDGRLYGRNYGQVVLAVPVLWLLRATADVVPVTVVLPALWSATLFGFLATAGRLVDRPGVGTVAGGGFALAALAVNVSLVGTVDQRALALVALQTVTVLAAALTAVLVYLLVRAAQGSSVGAVAGAAVVLATPVGFWATIPKRHSLTAFLAVLTLYLFYRSRDAPGVREATRYRALAYVPVGLTAWIHAPEGLVLFVALGAVDLPTARSNRPRHLAAVGAVFLLSLLPFLLTNALISGNPLEPPRALPPFEGNLSAFAAGGDLSTSQAPGGQSSGFATIVGIASTGWEKAGVFVDYLSSSAGTALEPARLFDVFVRSGHGLGLHKYGVQSVNLSVLESMPIAGALLVAPLVLYRRVARDGLSVPRSLGPARATDLLAVCYLSLLAVIYVPRLPLHVTFTVRYLHPLFPICVYLLARFRIVRRVVDARARLLAASYAGFVLVGGPLFALTLAAVAGSLGGAVQLNARLALAGAAVLVYWAVVATVSDGYERLGALAFSFAGATTTTFLVLSALSYFRYGSEFALPVVREIADLMVLV